MTAESTKKLQDASNTASGQIRSLWVAFVLFGTYLAIAVGSTTHVQLLQDAPIELPALSVQLPVLPFYRIAPPIFVILHLYILLELYFLSRTLRSLKISLSGGAGLSESETRQAYVELDYFIVTQALMNANRTIIHVVSVTLSIFTIIAAPLGLLVAFQLFFLPYHDAVTTWVHRGSIAADFGIIWTLWPALANPRGRLFVCLSIWSKDHGTIWQRLGQGLAMVTSVLVLLFSFVVATIPDECVDLNVWPIRPIREGIFNGTVDSSKEIASGWLSRNLIVVDKDIIAIDKLDNVRRTLDLRSRDLRYAILERTDLRKADLNDAKLEYADLAHARLEGAYLNNADLRGANLTMAYMSWSHLDGARLEDAYLGGADLGNVSLLGVHAYCALFPGTNIYRADLRYADLSYAQLQGAHIVDLDVHPPTGAILTGAGLQGATVRNAFLDQAKNISGIEGWPGASSAQPQADNLEALKTSLAFASKVMEFSNAAVQKANDPILPPLIGDLAQDIDKLHSEIEARGLSPAAADENVKFETAAAEAAKEADPLLQAWLKMIPVEDAVEGGKAAAKQMLIAISKTPNHTYLAANDWKTWDQGVTDACKKYLNADHPNEPRHTRQVNPPGRTWADLHPRDACQNLRPFADLPWVPECQP